MKVAILLIILFVLTACAFANGKKEIVVDENTTVIDVRSAAEYKGGHLEGALNIPHTEIKEKIAAAVPDKDRKIIVYCRSGRRSGIARSILLDMGYKNVTNAGAYKSITVKEAPVEGEK